MEAARKADVEMAEPIHDPWITGNEAARRLGRSALFVANAALRGELRTTITGGNPFYHEDDVEALRARIESAEASR